MNKVRNMVLAVALVAAFTAYSGVANAGAFGVPDPTLGATVLGWFDIAVSGTDDVLPVFLNASNVTFYGEDVPTGFGVHFIIWTVRSFHVWDKNIPFSPWDVEPFSIRDIILNEMSQAQRNLIKVTVVRADATTQDRYQGYWTATTVARSPGQLNPPDPDYPHLYFNVLTGWVYLVDILAGRTDGYAMVPVEASTLYAGDLAMAFTLSFSADFWNRWWWWAAFRLLDPDGPGLNFPDTFNNPGLTTENDVGPWFSNLWNCSDGSFYLRHSLFPEGDADPPLEGAELIDDKVYERFDALAGINSELLTRGLVVSSDDTWLGRLPGTGTQLYAGGGMQLTGRYFRNPAASIVTQFANKMVLWADVNGASPGPRHVVATIYDEEENPLSLTINFPDELTIIYLDDIVGTWPAGVITFDTNDIVDSNGKNGMRLFWRWFYNTILGGNANFPNNFFPNTRSCSFAAIEQQYNELQLLGWTTNEGLGSAQESWSAAFLMVREYYIGDGNCPALFITRSVDQRLPGGAGGLLLPTTYKIFFVDVFGRTWGSPTCERNWNEYMVVP
jgi:hypothetical protein